MKKIKYSSLEETRPFLERPSRAIRETEPVVKSIMEDIRQNGDEAVLRYTSFFDRVKLDKLEIGKAEIDKAESLVPYSLQQSIKEAAKNIEMFHRSQKVDRHIIETTPGVHCWQKSVPIEKVGIYIPGATAPLFSTVLMLGVPAKVAGCREIILCTPPLKDGSMNPVILYAASITGVSRVFSIGGAQAIGAMAYGTGSVPRVSKIFGPGNQYVMAAKQRASKEGIAIDIPEGPAEIMVIADKTANPRFVASDLLAQIEHGIDSQAILITTSSKLADEVNGEIEKQLPSLTRHDIVSTSLKSSVIIVTGSLDEAIGLANDYAPEQLVLAVKSPAPLAEKVVNAGSVFLGHYSTESAGDYASGSNHTLPSSGSAKGWSGVSLDSFVRRITFQEITKEGLANLGPTVMTMARAEGLDAHAMSVQIRIEM